MLAHRKPVEAYGEDGRLIGQWPSTLAAAAESGFSKTVIKNCAQCQQRDCQMCFYFRRYRRTWRYTEDQI